MDETSWKQVNIAWPSPDRHQRERQALDHLARVLPAVETDGTITRWFFLRKGPWRVRYQLAQDANGHDPVHALLTEGVPWTRDIYEPEIHAFGGPGSMSAAHALFHRDSHHLLAFLHAGTVSRREHSLVLCTKLMRTAGLDLNEQGDVWARVAEARPGLAEVPPDPPVWAAFTGDVRHLLLGEARPDLIDGDWIAAFEETGRTLQTLRERGELTRGIRAVITRHVIFHWNRLGLSATTQATLGRAAQEAIFGATPMDGTPSKR
ncbi:bacteriocin biosynthesis protein [Frankia sp. CcI49]|uniref:thiopeptide-type bacteriocin biosynthesis protein n=1 Tax=Frankia sp. CcI49 TaxID=1745382 RepID=UPI000975C1EE|nr:thiopeptide-type bacteriocin biosynthesis protein [Frankia sp. CcI49]ONH60389.1 bacteriocin biosynthesis protein [Frankia sp. CcI49]